VLRPIAGLDCRRCERVDDRQTRRAAIRPSHGEASHWLDEKKRIPSDGLIG